MKKVAFALLMTALPIPASAHLRCDRDPGRCCGEGMMWDSKAQACVPIPMS